MNYTKINPEDKNHLELLVEIGLVWVPNFLTHAEVDAVRKRIPPTPVLKKASRNSARRYGTQFPYEGSIIRGPIPEYLEDLNRKIVEAGLSKQTYQSISINEYLPGNCIGPHIDNSKSGETISIISLLGSAQMRLELEAIGYELTLESGSLIQMQEEVRWKWKHSILPVKEKRYSIVFRC